MKRDPAIHITKSALVQVLSQIDIRPNMSTLVLANAILAKCQPYQLTDRYKVVATAKASTKKKVKKSQEVESRLPKDAVPQFNRLLNVLRVKIRPYSKVINVDQSHKDYLFLKEITLKAYDFGVHFDLGMVEGFRAFIELGLVAMGKYRLNAFKTYEKTIYEQYESALEVKNDDDPENTSYFYELWRQVMQEYTSLEVVPNLKAKDVDYIHMVYGRKAADENNADYALWIEAQFEELVFLDTTPSLVQFYGANAVKRYERHNIKGSATKEEVQSLTDRYK